MELSKYAGIGAIALGSLMGCDDVQTQQQPQYLTQNTIPNRDRGERCAAIQEEDLIEARQSIPGPEQSFGGTAEELEQVLLAQLHWHQEHLAQLRAIMAAAEAREKVVQETIGDPEVWLENFYANMNPEVAADLVADGRKNPESIKPLTLEDARHMCRSAVQGYIKRTGKKPKVNCEK